ncbi:MAG: 4-hydroxyphenylpyruvate dioxygenase [Cyanobacteria bacterium]|nr:4-hydroxyphenylpyruvate dioxygenase [Cyanobacteriota bacterium]
MHCSPYMEIDHLHLYVDDANHWRDWFIYNLNFDSVSPSPWHYPGAQVLQAAAIQLVLSSAATSTVVADFLQAHTPGVGDLAFTVKDLDRWIARVTAAGGMVLRPIQHDPRWGRWCQVQGWGSLRHTLIERHCPLVPLPATPDLPWQHIDHAVLNVPEGELALATDWYECALGFRRQQSFAISTPNSGLRSWVVKHPEGSATFPINEPTSSTSQVQEFLDHHRGAGIQHAALNTQNLVATVTALRQRGISFLPVPSRYYEQLSQRPEFWVAASDWAAIAQQQILVDWAPETPRARLLQTFTEPLFPQPTFFLELIERQAQGPENQHQRAEGFGAGNFQALFEAIERQQQQRGNL